MNKTFYLNSLIEVKAAGDKKKFRIAGYANTTDKDRTGDIVKAEAWATGIDNYRKNPVLLYQHDHSKPIGRVDSITVDKKGIFVEAIVSDAAETQHSVQSLITDGALKSFSVGFRVKDAEYDKRADTVIIKEVELLEISVVSVPANQNSLFSVRKSIESDKDYKAFVESLPETQYAEEVVEEKAAEVVEEKTVEPADLSIEVTTAAEETKAVVEEEAVVEPVSKIEDPNRQIPFINLLSSDPIVLKPNDKVKIAGEEYSVVKIATSADRNFIFKKGKVSITTPVSEVHVVNTWDTGTEYEIHLALIDNETLTKTKKEEIISDFKSKVDHTQLSLFTMKNNPLVKADSDLQLRLRSTMDLLSVPTEKWADAQFGQALINCKMIDALKLLPQEEARDVILNIYGQKVSINKENDKMENEIDDVLVIKTDTKKSTTSVSEPVVQELINKAGEAVMRHGDDQDRVALNNKAPDLAIAEELAELRGQLKAYREQVNAHVTNKMVYQEQSRKSQFAERDMVNAVFVQKALNKRDVFDTRLGARMKGVLTDTNLNEAFSTNVYGEMQQQLVVAPMFNRLEVNQRDFRIPVADEDQSDFVAQFPSGSFAAGTTDSTTVPTSRQAQIASVTLSPHKFMVKTHIAKDEEEDTIIPLIDFLRASRTRGMARAIDKSLLRGNGALSAFSASNTLTAAGAYASTIKGVVELAAAVGALVTKTGTTIDKADPSDIHAARITLGKYGLTLGQNLVYITSVEGYNNLISNTDFQTIDKFGSQATYLTGSLGAIYGIPVYISEFMDSASAADSNLGVLVYKPGFVIGERRAMEIESEYLPEQQVTAMYMSTRFDFKALTTVSAAALSARYSYAGLITTASS